MLKSKSPVIYKYNYLDALEFIDKIDTNKQCILYMRCYTYFKELEELKHLFVDNTMTCDNVEALVNVKDMVTFYTPDLVSIYEFTVIEQKQALNPQYTFSSTAP